VQGSGSLVDPGIGSAPQDPPPTGSKWQGVEVDGNCGRTSLGWVLVDEVCAGTDDPAYLDYFHAPMFRDGASLNGLLYAVDATHLWVLDAAEPTHIGRHALLAGFGQPLAIEAYEQKLIVAGGSAGLLVLDTTEPMAPTLEATIPLSGPALDVHVDGTRAYVATGAAGLSIVDLAASPPALVATIPVAGFTAAVTVKGAHAFVAACDNFAIVDLAQGAVVSEGWLPQAYEQNILVAPAKDVTVVGDVAFVAAGRFGAVAIDVSDPLSPALIGNCTEPGDLSFYASGVRASGQRLFIAGGEWGVKTAELGLAPALGCPNLITPELLPLPDPGAGCTSKPPWEVVPWEDLWSPPPAGRDPIQILPADGSPPRRASPKA